MNNIWVFGCSFSSGYLDVPQTESYGNLISKKLKYGINNLANPGNSNDKILLDLVNCLPKIGKNDIVIYQFSSFDRIGHFLDNDYFSSAGFVQLGIDHKHKEWPFNMFKKEDMGDLLKYIVNWNPMRKKMILDTSIGLLNFISEIQKIKTIIMFMDNETILNENILILPVNLKPNNNSFHDYLCHNKLTISDDFPEKYDYYDTHPVLSGHKKIYELILDKINYKPII